MISFQRHQPHHAEVEFDDEDEDVEEVEVESTPKRSVHGRQPTAFVPKSKVTTGQARSIPA